MTPEEYQQAALRTEYTPNVIRTVDESRRDATPVSIESVRIARLLHGAIGACTEVGELQDAIKKYLIYGKPLDRTNIMEEVGDVMWYLNIICDAYGITWSEVFERNIAKLQTRYPGKFTETAALNRDLDAERRALEG